MRQFTPVVLGVFHRLSQTHCSPYQAIMGRTGFRCRGRTVAVRRVDRMLLSGFVPPLYGYSSSCLGLPPG